MHAGREQKTGLFTWNPNFSTPAATLRASNVALSVKVRWCAVLQSTEYKFFFLLSSSAFYFIYLCTVSPAKSGFLIVHLGKDMITDVSHGWLVL